MALRIISVTRAIRFAAFTTVAMATLLGCQYQGSTPSRAPNSPPQNSPAPTTESTSAPTPDATSAVTASPTMPLTTTRPATTDGTPATPAAVDPSMLEQARRLLARWDSEHGGASPDALEFTKGLVAGGGWNGDNGGDLKVALYAGWVESSIPLSTEVPPPGTVKWSDGTTQDVELISAADALAGLVADGDSAMCDASCTPLEVTGAHLTTVQTSTSRGDATVPAWEFEFVPDQEPIDPITFVAVEGATVGTGNDAPDTYQGPRIDAAYGNSASSQVTVSFIGSPWLSTNPCGAAYTATAVESELAVAVVVIEQHSTVEFPPPPSGAAIACPAVGAFRTATADLLKPLDDRTILDVNYGVPVSLKDEPAPSFPALP